MIKPIASGAIAFGPRGIDDGSEDDQDQEERHHRFHDQRAADRYLRAEPGQPEIDARIVPPHRSQRRKDERQDARAGNAARAPERRCSRWPG